MSPFPTQSSDDRLDRDPSAVEARKNSVGYAIAMVISIVLKLTVDYFGLSEHVSEVMIFPIAIALGGLIGEGVNRYVLASVSMVASRRRLDHGMRLIERKYERVRASLRADIAELRRQRIVSSEADQIARTSIDNKIEKLEAEIDNLNGRMREDLLKLDAT